MDRSLLQGPRLALVTSQKQFQAVARSAGINDEGEWLRAHEEACVHSYDDQGGLICIVALSLSACESLTPIEVAALLAHEAVHVWQRVEDMMPGAELGREMEAYAVQNIVSRLMQAYVKASSASGSRPA